MIIRLALPDDAKNIQKVFYKTWLETYPNKDLGITREDVEEIYKDRHDENKIKTFKDKILNMPNNSKLLVAEHEDNLIGVCRIFLRDDFNQLQSIYILPEYQGKGVGRMFWSECLKYFDKNKKIIVHVATYNTQAINFYKKLGFTDTGKRFEEERHRMPISKVLIPEMEMELKNHAK